MHIYDEEYKLVGWKAERNKYSYNYNNGEKSTHDIYSIKSPGKEGWHPITYNCIQVI